MASKNRRPPRLSAGRGWLLALCLLAASGHAQQAGPAASADEDADESAALTEFDTVRVVEKRPEWVDPYAFRPLFDPDDNVFQRRWNESPSVQDVSLSGGYLILGINYGLMKAAETVTRLPGWKHQIQPATARPPPLDAAQAERAARLRESGGP